MFEIIFHSLYSLTEIEIKPINVTVILYMILSYVSISSEGTY